MRIASALFFSCLLWVSAADAETYKISTARVPETQAITSLLKAVYREVGHDIDVVFRPAKRSLVEVNSGQADGEMARIIGTEAEYPNLVRVEEPVFALSFSALVEEKSKHWLSSWEEIGKHRIGYPRGYQILDIRTRGLRAMPAKDAATVARMVRGGRVDIGIVITSDAVRLAAETPGVTVMTPPIEVVTLYHYLHVRHRRLAPRLEKVLIEFNDSGRSKEIIQQTK